MKNRQQELKEMYKKGENVVAEIEMKVLDKLLSTYNELEPNEKVVLLDLVSSRTRDALVRLSLSSLQ